MASRKKYQRNLKGSSFREVQGNSELADVLKEKESGVSKRKDCPSEQMLKNVYVVR